MSARNKFIVVRSSKIQGRGVFAACDIPKGTRIIEYVGQHITDAQAVKRYPDEEMERHHTFLFGIGKNMVIDAAVDGNQARYINHSCNPNCEAVQDGKQIFIESLKRIPEGTELVYDYRLERSGRWQEKWMTQYACHCGSKNCRGTIIAPRRKRKTAVVSAKRKARKAAAV